MTDWLNYPNDWINKLNVGLTSLPDAFNTVVSQDQIS